MTRSACLAMKICLAGSLSLLALEAGAADERPCAIKRIEQTPTGVNVHFIAGRQVTLMRDDESVLYWIDANARESESAEGRRTRRALPLKVSERALVGTAPGERCALSLAQRRGKVGVDVELPGTSWSASKKAAKTTNPNTTFETFVPAD